MSIPHWISLNGDSSSPVGYILLLSRKFVKIQILLLSNLEIYNLSLIIETVCIECWRHVPPGEGVQGGWGVPRPLKEASSSGRWSLGRHLLVINDHIISCCLLLIPNHTISYHVICWWSPIVSFHVVRWWSQIMSYHIMSSAGDHIISYHGICWWSHHIISCCCGWLLIISYHLLVITDHIISYRLLVITDHIISCCLGLKRTTYRSLYQTPNIINKYQILHTKYRI